MKRLPGRKDWLIRKRSWFNVIPWGKLIVKFPMGYIVKNLDCDVLLKSMIYSNKSKNRWLFIAAKKLSDFFFLLIAEIEIVRLLSRLWFLGFCLCSLLFHWQPLKENVIETPKLRGTSHSSGKCVDNWPL